MLPMDHVRYMKKFPELKEPQQSLIVFSYSNLSLNTHTFIIGERSQWHILLSVQQYQWLICRPA